MRHASRIGSLLLLVLCMVSPLSLRAATPTDPKGHDAILHWNAIALKVVADDHSGTYGAPENGGPTRASWALAIVHIAMFDAVNAIDGSFEPYIPVTQSPINGASKNAAIAQAARETLAALYPNQKAFLDQELKHALHGIPANSGRDKGVKVGFEAALNILEARDGDGSEDGNATIHPPTSNPPSPGEHLPDPLNPGQGLLTPGWGQVATFSPIDVTRTKDKAPNGVRTPPPPALTHPDYTAAYVDVLTLGGDGTITPTLRTREETEIGLFWAYDGAKGIGVPPVIYNQIVRELAEQEHNSLIENARLFALVNIAMGDAGIAAWDSKYFYNVWRPIASIRNADLDGNDNTERFANWTPLGAPASNQSGNNFTPPFPAYPSGHATFGAAMFRTLQNFYGTDEISYRLKSDELNGQTTDSQGTHRPAVVRRFDSFSQGAIENSRSRIYLGIHWQFDADAGMDQGVTIADFAFNQLLQPVE